MNLPVEMIQHIFSFLTSCEVVRLRQVSKKFRDITHNRALWRVIYANARLLLPRGPFPWQSTQYLERTLLESELISKTWTSQPLKQLSRTSTSWKLEQGRGILWSMVFGRWCIFLHGETIKYRDIDTNTYHFLYDGTAHPGFQFTAGAAAGINGKHVYLLLADRHNQLIKLLKFCVDNDSFSEPEVMDWTHNGTRRLRVRLWPSTHDVHNSAPFLVVGQHERPMVLDLLLCCLYSLPEKLPSDLANELQLSPTIPQLWNNSSTQVILTRSHVVAVHVYGWSSDMHVLFRAFVVPDLAALLDRNGVGELRLTHEVAIPTALPSFTLLRNSIIDPVTGSVNIRFLQVTPNIQNYGDHKDMWCLDLTLPKPVSATDVLPISIRSQHLFESRWTSVRCTASDDGYVRGLLLTHQGPPPYDYIADRKFSIDASGEECTAAISDSSQCPVNLPRSQHIVTFDGRRGQIHYSRVMPVNLDNIVNQVVTISLV
ncbi:hypothetical protein OG21DRAFT_1095400 [Imleria badia]|nr:hypothetical protein OG21DRAFT_1095400 [Imleria badia]